MTSGIPLSTVATSELVVPRSMPTILLMSGNAERRDGRAHELIAATRIPGRLAVRWIRRHCASNLIDRNDPKDLVQCGLAFEDATQAVLPHRLHALLNGDVLQGAGRNLLQDGIPEDFVGREQFSDGGAADEAGASAVRTADAPLELCGGQDIFRDQFEQAGFGLVSLDAMRAVLADEPDAEHTDDARGEQKGLNLHVDQPGEYAGRDSAVNGADDQVSREAGLHGDARGLRIANLADHDHLRILAHERPKGFWIRELLAGVDLRLADHREVELHRVFYRAHTDGRASALHNGVEGRVDRGGLTGAGRAGEQNQPTRPSEQLEIGFERLVVNAERGQIEAAIARVKQADDDLFTPRGWKNGDTQLHSAQFRTARCMALLREIGHVADEAGHDFDATGDLVHQVEGEMHQFGEHSAQADANDQRVFPRLDVDVAGAGVNGVREDMIDQHANLNAFLGGIIGLEVVDGLVHGTSLVAQVISGFRFGWRE